MSRFEFSIPRIEEGLLEMYAIKDQIGEEILALERQKSLLKSQNSLTVRRARDALNALERKLDWQEQGMKNAITCLKQIKQEVKIAEWKAQRSQTADGGFLLDTRQVFDAGFISPARIDRLFFADTLSQDDVGWWKPLSGGGTGLAALGILGGELVNNTTLSGAWFKTETSGETSTGFRLFKDGNWDPNIGAEAKGEAVFALGEGSVTSTLGLMQSETTAAVGKVAASGKAECALFDDGNLSPNIGVEGKLSAEGISLSQESTLGSEEMNFHTSQELTAGYAEAKAGVNLGTDGISAEAKAGAYAAKGKATTGFDLFGITVDVEGEAKVGGASIGGEFGISSNEIAVGGEIGILAGLGLKIKISWD